MPLAATVSAISFDNDFVYLIGKLVPSGTYPTGGDTFDFTKIVLSPGQSLPVQSPPVALWVGGSTGDSYGWVAGTALNNQLVKVNTASNTELANSAYPARITGDANINFEAVFNKLQ